MTCREKLKIEHPALVGSDYTGGCNGCPDDYGYLPKPELCIFSNSTCNKCWDREIPEEDEKIDEIGTKHIVSEEDILKSLSIARKECDPPTIENPHILDSGNRREFESGAVRDIQEGKGRCDLLPLDICACYIEEFVDNERAARVFRYILRFQEYGAVEYLYFALNCANPFEDNYTMILEVAKQFEEGAKKYGERNWQKGIHVHCYIDSAVRHYVKYLRGDKDEPHDRAVCWNLMCAIWTCKHKPELNEYADEEKER